MAIYHLSAKLISRKTGRSSTAAAAYRACERVVDERTGEIHDYTRKKGLEHSEIVIPSSSEWRPTRTDLWNSVELKNKRADAQVAREFVVGLPDELSPAERRDLAVGFAREISDRYSMAADVAIHAPSKHGDDRNHHAHILTTTNRIEGQSLGNKVRELDLVAHNKGGKLGQINEIDQIRSLWATLANDALARAGHEVRIDHRSHAERGIETAPTLHLGPAASGFERRTGEPSRKRLDFEQEASERLARARDAGELERQGQALDRSILDPSGDLAAAKADRSHQQALEAFAALARARYVQALDRVTSETLATVPGLLPVLAVKQALHQVGQEVQAEGRQIQPELNLAEIRRQVLAQPAYLRRLQQADEMDAQAQATLTDVDSMGVLKRMVFDTRAMSEEAHRLQTAAQVQRDQVRAAVEQSPELRAARQSNQEQEQTRRRVRSTTDQLREMQGRIAEGQPLWQRPAHVYRVPETVTRVVNAARSMAPSAAQGMPPAEVKRMTGRAADLAWKAPANQREHEMAKSRFVLPAEERQQQLEREAKREKSRGYGL